MLGYGQNDSRKWLLVLLSDIGVNFHVIPTGIFFLPFSKCHIVSDTANAGIDPWILLRQFHRYADWSDTDAAGPIKLDMPRANVLLGFLRGISRIPSLLRGET